jgi:hypothetical protein
MMVCGTFYMSIKVVMVSAFSFVALSLARVRGVVARVA